MAFDPKKMDRLPRWAREELLRLDRRLRETERLLADARGGIRLGDTDTLAHPYDDVPLTLAPGSSVGFRLGQTWRGDVIRVRIRDGRLNLNGDNGLLVLPRATNDVDVILGRH